jgi:hypothetical protein
MPDLTGDVTTSAGAVATTIANNAVSFAKFVAAGSAGFVGATGAGNYEHRTPTQVTAALDAFTGDSGAGGVKGLVPAPAAGDAAANKFLKADGTWTASSAPSAATQAEQETGTSTTVYVSPGRQQFHASACKAWVVWGISSTIAASYNVASITDTGTGDWTIVIDTDFSSANYVTVAGYQTTGVTDLSDRRAIAFDTTNKIGASVRVMTYNMDATDTLTEAANDVHNVAMFGDQ